MDDLPIMILADKNGGSWNFASSVYNQLNSNPDRDHKYQLAEVGLTYFSDGERFVKILDNVRGRECYFIHDATLNPQDWFVTLDFINDALMRSSAEEVNNVLPYMMYSRQDRMAEPRTPISSSRVAKMIEENAKRVLTCDLHNPATTSAYNIPFDNLKAYPVITDFLQERYHHFLQDCVIVAPDVGSAKRAESYSKILGLDVAISRKKREKANVVKEMTIIGEVAGKNTLIVDDMIDTGGTLCEAAKVLKERGAKRIFACATHGVFSGEAYQRFEESELEKILITNSIPKDANGKIEIIDISGLFASAIYRITHGDSVSALFRN